ncbi:MAG: hypothetical protein PHF92_03865 [Bacteroidales bacterium]|nr:hypothetical protein [Bacteroidales bacterium]
MNTQLLSFYILLNIILVNSFACQGATYSYQSHLLSRQTENPDRGLMATAISENSAFISWRLLLSDKPDQVFELYKLQKNGDYQLIHKAGPKDGCNYTDTDYNATSDCSYWVKAPGSKNDKAEAGSRYTLKAGRAGMNYISVPLQTLPGHVPGDCSAGDLDGDGQYEIIVKQEMRPRDNSHDGFTGQTKLEAYSLDGEFLWRIDLGKNIREGAHYTQFMVYDLDGDGKAEIACKTADGTIDGQGKVLGDPQHPEHRAYAGQGNHNLSVADVDQDGFDEIVYGNMVVDHDGKGLYTTGIGHADAMHLSDLDPDRPGLEVFNTQEPVGDYGMNFRNAGSGEIYWNIPTDREAVARERKVQGPGRAVAFDIDPRHRGAECWVFGGGISGLYNCKGEKISERTPSSCNFAVWWDGDLLRELLDRNYVAKYNWEKDQVETLFVAENCTSNNGSKATPALSADLFGDWREEIVFRTIDMRELRIFSTQIPSPHRMVTLMQDPVYRLGVAWQNVAYNIPPHLSRYLE